MSFLRPPRLDTDIFQLKGTCEVVRFGLFSSCALWVLWGSWQVGREWGEKIRAGDVAPDPLPIIPSPRPPSQSRKEAGLLSDFHVGLMCKILLEESVLLWEKKLVQPNSPIL